MFYEYIGRLSNVQFQANLSTFIFAASRKFKISAVEPRLWDIFYPGHSQLVLGERVMKKSWDHPKLPQSFTKCPVAPHHQTIETIF